MGKTGGGGMWPPLVEVGGGWTVGPHSHGAGGLVRWWSVSSLVAPVELIMLINDWGQRWERASRPLVWLLVSLH